MRGLRWLAIVFFCVGAATDLRAADVNAKATDAVRIQKAYRLALGRLPRDREIKDAGAFVIRYTQLATAKGKNANEARVAGWGSFLSEFAVPK